jgi:hypothetical protein
VRLKLHDAAAQGRHAIVDFIPGDAVAVFINRILIPAVVRFLEGRKSRDMLLHRRPGELPALIISEQPGGLDGSIKPDTPRRVERPLPSPAHDNFFQLLAEPQ